MLKWSGWRVVSRSANPAARNRPHFATRTLRRRRTGDHFVRQADEVFIGSEEDRQRPEPEHLHVGLGRAVEDVVGQRPLAAAHDERGVSGRDVTSQADGAGRHPTSEPVAGAQPAVSLTGPLVGR